jgi:hypothetical protein
MRGFSTSPHSPLLRQFVRFYQFLLNASIVTRWTLFIIPILLIVWIPGILSFTASPSGKVRRLLPYALQGPRTNVFFTDMGSRFDMVEHLAERRLGWYDHLRVIFKTSSFS